MNEHDLSNYDIIELKKKCKAIKMVIGILAVVLTVSVGFFTFISIRDGLSPIMMLPFVLAVIIPVNLKKLKAVKEEIESREK